MKNGFAFSTAKTQCIHVTRLRGLHLHPNLSQNNSTLPFVPSVKFMGLLDSRLSALNASGHWIFRKFYLFGLGVVTGRNAPSLPVAFPLRVRLWQLRVWWLCHQTHIIYHRPCPQYGNICPATGAFRTSRCECIYVKLVSLHCLYVGIFSFADMLRSWQLSPTTRHMVQYSVPAFAPYSN
jgi:hypothetical protein